MGQYIFKNTLNSKNNQYEYINLINNKNNHDKSLLTITGSLLINKKTNPETIINFYEDYLIISYINYNEIISYYKIHSWGYNKFNNLWRFNKNDKTKLIVYDFYLDNKYACIDICDTLSSIIKDHINFKNDF